MSAITTKEDCVLLDVRTDQEYAKGKIAGSVHVPVDEIEENIQQTIPDKNKKVYVYCLSGSRSVIAVDTMMKLGYSNVYDMKNGLLAWRMNGFNIESKLH